MPTPSTAPAGPVGSGDYAVQQGDCIASIAHEAGLLWQTIWDYPDNADVKNARKNPNALLPGDRLVIPKKKIKQVEAATDQQHTFVRKDATFKFRMVVERYQKPLANKHYVLTIDGQIYEGTTSSTGLLEVALPPSADTGVLRIPEENLECDLQFGYLDPLNEISGAQARLQNLGYYHGEISGEMNDDLQEAIQLFQSDFGVPVTGELDDATKDKLLARHDQEHDPPPASSGSATEEVVSNDIPSQEDDIPSEEEDESDFQALERVEDEED